ncbi:MAG: hypothetical protein PHY18_04310 [Dehalococcoidales bacterium]|nr:hypothetical protein [Dehalococcoidales bacterium]
MGTAAVVFGSLAAVCATIGGLTAGGIIPLLLPEFTWMFWLIMSGVLFLASIAFSTARRGGGGEE